jgi:DNA-binding transcriptional LysR family regulator
MALTLRHIEVIRAVLRAGTVTGAARQLAVSQPALSRTLKNAETRLGLQLFERRSGRLSPTPEVLALQRDIEKARSRPSSARRPSCATCAAGAWPWSAPRRWPPPGGPRRWAA